MVISALKAQFTLQILLKGKAIKISCGEKLTKCCAKLQISCTTVSSCSLRYVLFDLTNFELQNIFFILQTTQLYIRF